MFRLLLFFLLLALLVLQMQMPVMAPGEAWSWYDEQPDLQQAVAELREEDDALPLKRWLAGAGLRERQYFGMTLVTDSGPEGSDAELDDPRVLYRRRASLRILLDYPLGHEALTREFRNALAYGLVAGTAAPSPEEVAEAEALMEETRQELDAREVEAQEAHLVDTIACIDFRRAAFALAAEGFATALRLTDPEDPNWTDFRSLLQQRLEAAEAEQPPLPLEWQPDTPADAAPATSPEAPRS